MSLWNAPTDQLITTLENAGLSRGYVATDPRTGAVRTSHACLDDIAAAVADDKRDYDAHAGAFFEIGAESGHLMSAFVHRTDRGQAAGGVRFWRYSDVAALVADGLRLSRGMGQKCALAGLWWGGGKGVIARQAGRDYNDLSLRAAIFRDYGRFVTGLCGLYVTAEDVGTRPQDMASIFETTRFTTCIPPHSGGSGNPGVLTAAGVVAAMEAAMASHGVDDLAGLTVAMQGLGNVSSHMIGLLLDRGVERVIGVDVDPDAVANVTERYAGGPVDFDCVELADEAILASACDIVAPNAVGGALNPRTIPTIRAPVVCGAANNQLEDPARDGEALRAAGVLYVPDFLANRMGIVNCANEQYGVLRDDPAIARHLDRDWPEGVYQRCLAVINGARAKGRSTHDEAALLADRLSLEPHPVWPGRGADIAASLVDGDWSAGGGTAAD